MMKYYRTVAIATMLLTFTLSANAALLSIVADKTDMLVGEELTVEIVVSELGGGNAPSLGAFDFNFEFDDVVFSIQTLDFGTGLDVLGFGSLQGASFLDDNLVNLFELSLDTADDLNMLQSDSFTLIEMTFAAITAGVGKFSVENVILSDGLGDLINTQINQAQVAVLSPVNAPASVSLLLVSIIALKFRNRL